MTDRSARWSIRGFLAGLFLLTFLPPPAAWAGAVQVLDDFEDSSAWTAHPADGVELGIRPDDGDHGSAMRLDFRFLKGGGYAIARREVSIDLPENYAFSFRLRGEAPVNHLEFKLIDASGENVWWYVRRDLRFPKDWTVLQTKKRQIRFAWGPIGGGEIRHVAAIEFAVTAGSGGQGSVWIDDLELKTLPPQDTLPPRPIASASSSAPGVGADLAVDGNPKSYWSSARGDRLPSLTLDLGTDREYGGLVLDWMPGLEPRDYAVEAASEDGAWRALREVRGSNGGRDYLLLPEAESRQLRIRAVGGVGKQGMALCEIELRPLEWGATPERFYESIARDAPRGSFPRGILGEQSVWTIVGTDDGDDAEGLLSEDGMLETGKAQFSIEPFLFTDGRLVTWSDVRTERWLDEGDLPIPSVKWIWKNLELTVTVFALDGAGTDSLIAGRSRGGGTGSHLAARYRLRNGGEDRTQVWLCLALRPFQVNPPSQFLNTPGGTAHLGGVRREGRIVRVNGDRGVISLSDPTSFGAATFDQGDIVEYLREKRVPPHDRVADPFDRASAALVYRLDVRPGAECEVDLLVPLHGPPESTSRIAPAAVERSQSSCAARWRSHRRGITIDLPPSASDLVQTAWAQIAYILVNRDGPAIQPGSRSYERSWIRDGSLTSSALLRMGHADVVRHFIEWFAGYRYDNGKVPCCVDRRGSDPVPEHDSHGELIFAIAEYYRYTGDRATVERLWPAVAGAAAYIDTLRQQRRTPEWREPGREPFFGILPPSISHEGYSAKPMHSYWDDFFALRGLKDATYLAGALGREEDSTRLAAERDEFQRDLASSIRAAMAAHAIDYIPGCADLGDFDATSTSIALDPVEAVEILPAGALEQTFEKYWDFFLSRRDGALKWEAFTPYEMRNIGASVLLGRRDRAQEMTRFFLDHRSPPEWKQWAEVVWNDPTSARFIGDLPHTWVGSDYVRSFLDMIAYTDRDSGTLVLGAGVPFAWIEEAPGLRVKGLPTPYGRLAYEMRMEKGDLLVRIGEGLRMPEGGILVAPPQEAQVRRAIVNGSAVEPDAMGRITVRELPAMIVLSR